MANSTDDLTIALINNMSLGISRYITLFVFLFGTIGNLLNILVFSQPALRLSPCSLYFLGSSTSSLAIILVGLPSRLIGGWISTDPTNTSTIFCKIRIFLLYTSRTIYIWLIVLAAIDRWFSSSTQIHRRQLSSYKNAWHSILFVCSLSVALWIEILYCYDANVTSGPVKCYGKTHTCRTFNDIVYASSTVVIPSILMLLFGFLTIRNINRSHRAVQPFVITTTINVSQISRRKPHKLRRSEGSLTRMLLLQVILITFCSIPQALHQFYLTLTADVDKSAYRMAIENFIVNFDFSLTYIGNGASFYIYTLNGTIFRQILIRIIQTTIRQWQLYFTVGFDRIIAFISALFVK